MGDKRAARRFCYRGKRAPVFLLGLIGWAGGACSGGADGDRAAPGDDGAGAVSQVDPSSFLYVWAADDDGEESDFLAVIDVRPDSPTYAEVITTLPVGFAGSAHHSEHVMPEGGILFVNAFDAGLTFLIDVREPAAPRIAGYFETAGDYSHPHSFERLPNGNVLATFQRRVASGDGLAGVETGGLVELDPAGVPIRSGSAAVPDLDPKIRPYSLAILPSVDRVVTTSTDMEGDDLNPTIQVWRLSDLSLLTSLVLEPGAAGTEHLGTAEPRVLADGRTVLVSTFSCGLYRLADVEGDSPSASLVYSFPSEEGTYCALPVLTERYWVHTVPAENALITLDISDPGSPVEVARLNLAQDDEPHWIGLEPDGERIVLTGYRGLGGRVLLVRLNRETGELTLEESFRTPGASRPGVDLRRAGWPHGETGPAAPHGAVFSRG